MQHIYRQHVWSEQEPLGLRVQVAALEETAKSHTRDRNILRMHLIHLEKEIAGLKNGEMERADREPAQINGPIHAHKFENPALVPVGSTIRLHNSIEAGRVQRLLELSIRLVDRSVSSGATVKQRLDKIEETYKRPITII